ncbi:MAG: ribose 5-phosphate isomerase A, partial [Alphaproteobacteria bacterium]|nr:ribose 5-phosphate isomerase A [Alphaproteobacteria bacterium]
MCIRDRASAALAERVGVALFSLESLAPLDLTVDGADEVDSEFRAIKGGGGCHLREKEAARCSARVVLAVDESKLVARLGRFPLPLEVAPRDFAATAERLRGVFDGSGFGGAALERRARADGSPFITDGGNFILDAALGAVSDPAALAACLDGVDGLLAHGFFIDEADALVVGYETGEHRLLLRDRRDDGDNKGVRGNNKGVRDDGDNEGARGRQSVRNVGDNKGVGDDEGARGRQSVREGRGDRDNEGARVSEVAAGAN